MYKVPVVQQEWQSWIMFKVQPISNFVASVHCKYQQYKRMGNPELWECTMYQLYNRNGNPELCTGYQLNNRKGTPELCTRYQLNTRNGSPELCTRYQLNNRKSNLNYVLGTSCKTEWQPWIMYKVPIEHQEWQPWIRYRVQPYHITILKCSIHYSIHTVYQ